MVAARRNVLILVALAACDQVYGLDGRNDGIVDGGGGGGTDDGPILPNDAAPTGCFFAEPSTSGIGAQAWFPDATLTSATRLDGAGNVEIGRAIGKTVDMLVSADYSSAFVGLPPNYSAMFHPSLSGDGSLLVGSLADVDNTRFRLATSTRFQEMYAMPALVDLRTKNDDAWTLDVSDTPSGPTDTPQRHLVISRSTHVVEVVQTSTQWRTTSERPATDFGLGAVSYATLTSDGLGLVLVGTTSANPSAQKVFRATRTDIDTPFGPGVEIFRPSGNGVRSAYLTADCSKLYFVQQGEVRYIER